jgi:hypothetical protein
MKDNAPPRPRLRVFAFDLCGNSFAIYCTEWDKTGQFAILTKTDHAVSTTYDNDPSSRLIFREAPEACSRRGNESLDGFVSVGVDPWLAQNRMKPNRFKGDSLWGATHAPQEHRCPPNV